MAEAVPPTKKQKTGTDSPTDTTTVLLRFIGLCEASVFVNNQKVGEIKAHLVQRNKRFHQKCDEISRDLQAISVVMFESDGSDRCKELTSSTKTKKKKGGFLYIDTITYEDGPHKQNSDVGARALRQFLTSLDGQFTVAAYIGDSTEAMTREERRKLEDDRLQEFHRQCLTGNPKFIYSEEEENEKEYRREVQSRNGISSDVRQCVRNGFQELSEETAGAPNLGYMYLTEDRWIQLKEQKDQMSHPASLQVKLRADVPISRDNFRNKRKDEQLQRYLIEKGGSLSRDTGTVTVASILEHTDQLVQQGADYNRANALHACAANGITALLDPLVRRGALINSKDKSHMTPLMVAAYAAPGRRSKSMSVPPSKDIRALLALGADKNVQDNVGKTALGHFYEAMRGSDDFFSCFGLPPPACTDPTIEGLLRPSGGATEADMRCKGRRA